MADLLIKNGLLASPEGISRGDVLLRGGRIAALGPGLPGDGAEALDASGLLVLPGGVDVHTHFNLTAGGLHVDDGFFSASRSAAFGGTTCIVEHPGFGPEGCGLLHQIEAYRAQAASEMAVDYGLHGVFQRADDGIIAQMEHLAGAGAASAKVYLTYGGKLDDAAILRVLQKAGELGLLIAFHAENDAIIAHLRAKYLAGGRTAPIWHARSRPDYCEAEAVGRILNLARAAGDVPVYIVHLSSAAGLEAIRRARAGGQVVFAETCPQYLLLDESRYERPDGLKYIMAPPLRTPADCRALWQGLAGAEIDVVATDHCAFNYGGKLAQSGGSFAACPGGVPGVETRLPLLYSEGVRRGRISLERMVEVCCTAPARIMGLGHRKGSLRPGLDGDLVLLDPGLEKTIAPDNLDHPADYSPFEGMPCTGWPAAVILRGEVIMQNGSFLGRRGGGEYLHRKGNQGLNAS